MKFFSKCGFVNLQCSFITALIYLIPWIAANIPSSPEDGVFSCNRSRIHISNSSWGIISDGPTNYTQNSHCEWLIEAPDPNDLITLMVHSLRTECSYDYLFIFDGKSYRDSLLLASLSGATKPLVPFVARSGFMLLLMYSDTNYALEGFIGEYVISPCPQQCTNWTTECTGEARCACNSIGSSRDACDPMDNKNININSSFLATPSKSLQRIGHSGIRLGHFIYIYGGFDLNLILSDLIIIDLTSETIHSLKLSTAGATYNEVRDDTDVRWPTGRYGHAAVQFKTGFFVQGGRTQLDGISNELLYFDTAQTKWKTFIKNQNSLPKLIYHTMAMTKDHVIYVYGGGTASGAFSSTLYKFHAEEPEKWEIVHSFCCGKTKDRSLLAHTMNYWPERNALLVFGGLVSDLGRFAKLSSQLWMFLIDTQVWLTLDYRKPQPVAPSGLKIIERAFHSAESIGNHLVMLGGYTHAHNRDEVCYAQHILLYNVECHVLVPEDPLGNSMEGEGVFGHRSIFWKRETEQEVLVIGGYRGYLNPKVGRIPLSLSSASAGSGCGTYDKRWRCSGDPLCGWCPTDEKCYEKISGSKNCTTNLQTSQCPGICPTLKTCQPCVLSGGCNWCETLDICIKSEESGVADHCPSKNIRTTLSSCIGMNERQGITLAEYRQPVDLAQPDSLRFLNATAFIIPRDVTRVEDGVTTMFIMKGILLDATSPMNRMELCALQSYVQLTMSTISTPAETLSVFLGWSDVQSCVNLAWASGLPVSLMPGTRIMFELIANSTQIAAGPGTPAGVGVGGASANSVQKILPEKFGHVSLRHNSKIFRKEYLQLFSSNGESCGHAESCLFCLTDASCAWVAIDTHVQGGSCQSRTESLRSGGNSIVVITPMECSLCQDFTTCSECLRRKDCEWSEEEAGCSRKGRTPPALLLNVEDPASCSPDCHLRKNCSTCLDIAGACVWCSQTSECFAFSIYTSFYQYGQCYSWKDKGSQCQECVKQSNCEDCILHLGCGWNYNESGGSCTEGDFQGPHANDDENLTVLELTSYNYNESAIRRDREWTWTYDLCPDVDECALGLDECHENATCTNTAGGYVCLCRQGFTGDGKSSCDQTCYDPCVHGSCNVEFVCECELGWTGVDCSLDCGCNNHSTCINGAGNGCDKCQDFTEGTNCDTCVSGSFGNATLGNLGCRECECNWNGDPNQGFCDPIDGRCFCLKHTTGPHCSKCEPGYFGNPELGESCYRDCHGRAVMDSSYGFFGIDPARGHANTQHCVWIINAKTISTSTTGAKSRREIKQDAKFGIRITISSNFHIPCSENALRIYSGLPSFSRPTKNAQLLASICAYEGEKIGQHEVVVDVDGDFATVVIQYAHGSLQKALFNASFHRMSATGNPNPNSPPLETLLLLEIEKLSDGQSVLPRFGHTLHADERNVWIFGGYSFSHGFLNDIRQFRRDVNQWIPLTITVVQNEDSVPLARYFHAGVLGLNSDIFIHGGISANLSFLSDTWRFDTRLSRWKRLFKERKTLRLAGHSLTLRSNSERNQCQLVLVGGINPENGFSNKVFYFPCQDGTNWEETNTTGSSPVGIYGHTNVYHRQSDTFYIFGGVVYERDKVLVSPNLYALHWPSKRWTLLPPNPENQVLPLPSARFFHSAVTTESGSYMVVLGGAGSPRNFSLMGYVYQCNLWVLFGDGKEVQRSGGGASVSNEDLLVMGGWDGISSKESLMRINLPRDVCSIQIPEAKCKVTLGCSYCSSNNNYSQQCYNSSLEMPKECSSGASNIVFWKGTLCSHQWMEGRNCSHYTTCSDCLASWPAHPNLKQACQWCTNCQVGKCIPVSKKCQGEAACGLKQRETIDSSHCPERLCSASECEKCTASGKCIWTRQILKSSEWSFQLHSQPLYDWNCVRKSILDTSPSFTVSSSPPEKCPTPCVHYQTCEDCLNAPGSDGGFQECHWSLSLNHCVSPGHKNLVCFGGVCGSVLRGSPTICPKPCSAHTSCSSCLEFPHCGWCATEGRNGEGRCLQGDYFSAAEIGDTATSPATVSDNSCPALNWNYLTCPPENECINNHHTCNDASENCIDLLVSFQCVCRVGYEKSKDFCVPICHQGCVHGNCVSPDKCHCHFGFVGTNCTYQCNCNGHSHCASEAELDICLDCKNNTMGTQCSRCKHFFVGDPKNGGTCIPCGEYCNGHSEVCLGLEAYEKSYNGTVLGISDTIIESQIKSSLALGMDETSEPGPLNRAFCISCKHETSGEKCDDCIAGYFRGTDDKRLPCRKCECHGHGDKCDSVTGLDCNCSNNTESEHCTQGNKQSGQQCWKLQCAKCREYYLGVPTNGHHCYRQMHVDTDYCFDPKSQESCGANAKPLLSGRTIYFAVQPKFMNVNIRIHLDVTHGAVHAYLSPKEDTFVIRQDSNTWMHLVEFDIKYNIGGIAETSLQEEQFSDSNLTESSVIAKTILNDYYELKELEAAGFATHVKVEEARSVLLVRNLRNRLVITLPQEDHDLRLTRFYIVLEGIGDLTYGSIFFRQDQLHIDLFVFFSVFFSAFFLFLAACGIAWKFKQNLETRRARHRHAEQMLSMAKRPFAVWTLILEPDSSSPLYRVYNQCRKSCRKGCICLRPVAIEPTVESSSAVCTMFVSLPGGSAAPLRLALASGLSNIPTHHIHTRRRRH